MEDKKGFVLAVDDNEDILFALKLLLKNHVEEIHTTASPSEIPKMMEVTSYDVILLDMNFTKDASSGQEGFDWLKKILDIDLEAVVVFITAYGDAEKAVSAIKAGATDFVLKPWQNEKLLATLHSAMSLRKSKVEVGDLRSRQQGITDCLSHGFKDFIGNSPEMKEVFTTINKVAKTDANILILGENGTGKELVARALHKSSFRKDEIFLSVDLGAITETLFESELFGYVKGAFTDAKQDKAGRFEIASKGTLFLDEIGNLSLPLQTKLLTVLERREIVRVGATKPILIDVRLICATNTDIHEMVAQTKFRQDLLYRVNTVEIHLPPLRERTGDISLLADYYLETYAKKYKKNIKSINAAAHKKLNVYTWPGNVRELQHAIERAIIMADGNVLTENDFILTPSGRYGNDLELDNFNLEDIEKKVIQRVLKQCRGNITQAATELGLTRTSLYRRMEKYGL